VILSASFLTIILVFSGFFTYERMTYRKLLLNDIETKAAIIAENSNAALAFRDSTDAARVLNSLASQPHFIGAAIYDSTGRIFAVYMRPRAIASFPSKPQADMTQFEDDALVSYEPVMLNGTRLGTLYLRSDLAGQRERFWSYIEIALMVLIGTLAITYLVATVLAKNIAAPIVNLTDTVRQVSDRHDYTTRASKSTNDETGFLADSFNRMIEQIQERDDHLRQTNQALQNSEQRYRTTLDGMMEGCQIIDFDFRYVYLNDVAALQGHFLKEKLLGHTMMEIYPGIDQTPFFEKLRDCRERRAHHRMENEFTYPDGSKGWFNLSIEPVPEGVFILSADITPQKQLAEELRRHREQLEEMVKDRTVQLESANKELEAFSYSVSHDLRAPLRHIDGFADLLQKQSEKHLDEKGRRLLKTIADSAKQMGMLIDDLLVFSSMGRVEMHTRTVNISEIVRGLIERMGQDTQGRVVEWVVNGLPDVQGDASMLRLVYQNLLENAVKYSRPREKTKIEIGCVNNQDEYNFFVRDNGVGFDMQYVGKLFGVFQRLHRLDEFEGTGIGLANVRRIIARHGGRTWAEAVVDQGATIYFSLPKARKENV
jgi:PAS domain S-box-containing protein